MIFATIGTQIPFDRFVRMLDEACAGIGEEVIVQTINPQYKPKHLKVVGFLPPDEFAKYFDKARLVVAHAGMGTILSALSKGKPIIIVPRLASLGEHRNDHQMITAMRMNELGYVRVAYDGRQLAAFLKDTEDIKPLIKIDDAASKSLTQSICDFIEK